MWVRNWRAGARWVKGSVVEQLGPLSYRVKIREGVVWKRHIDQLRERGSTEGPEVGCRPPEEPQQSVGESSYSPVPVADEAPDDGSGRSDAHSSGVTGTTETPTVSNDNTHSNSTSSDISESARYPRRSRQPPDRYDPSPGRV